MSGNVSAIVAFDKRVDQIMRATGCGRREAAELIGQEDPALYSEALGKSPGKKNNPGSKPGDGDPDKKFSPAKGPKPKRIKGPSEDDEDAEDDGDADDDPDDDEDDDDDNPKRQRKGAQAIGQWQAALAQQVARGMSAQKAVKTLAREQPRLRQRYVEACNEQARMPRREANADARDELGTLQAKWDAAVQAEMARGLPRSRAAASAARLYPKLRQSLTAAATAASRMRV
jgi:hypothetical protein